MTIRDGMPIRDHFTLDTHGFTIARQPTAVTRLPRQGPGRPLYESEVERHVQALTGADKVVARGWMIRTSADLSERAAQKAEGYTHSGGIQPPAGEAHVDTNTPTARRMAQATYDKHFPDGPGFKRFLVSSYWRTFSPAAAGRAAGDLRRAHQLRRRGEVEHPVHRRRVPHRRRAHRAGRGRGRR